MLSQILLTTVLLPLALGVVIALPGKGESTKSVALTALLVPLASAIASVAIEGLPAFPPIAAKQKLPVLLFGGGIIFAGLAVVLKAPLQRGVAALVSVLSLAVPAWWLGRNVLLANPTKAATLAMVLVIVAFELFVLAGSRARKPAAAALPAALVATAIGTALTAILGGYIGMAQMNGALAALFGGWLLVRYIAYLRGDDDAFVLQGMAAFSFAWTAAAVVAMTVLFAPSASPAALVLCVLPAAIFVALNWRRAEFARQPRALRPLISGGLAALPAIIAILIAALNEG